MFLYYDSISGLYSLQIPGQKTELLGPYVHTTLVLRDYGLTAKQAREAAMRAMMNRGDGIDVEAVKRMAALQ